MKAENIKLQAALQRIGNLPLEFNTRARALAQEVVGPPKGGWLDPLTPEQIRKVLHREPLHRKPEEKLSTETKEAIAETKQPETGTQDEKLYPVDPTTYQPPEIDMVPVESSNIESVGHDGKETLRVQFKGSGAYDYVGIDEESFFELVNSPSVGKAYGAMTRSKGIKGIKL